MTMPRTKIPVLLLLVGAAACDRTPELEVRTFRLSHLRPHEAQPMIDPYVFVDREGAPGKAMAIQGAITVRETPDNLDRIQQVLAEYDQARADVRLHFQLIEADGFTESDARIADVEREMQKIFQFEGYRLAGEAFVSATDHSEITQGLKGTDDRYEIRGVLYWLQAGVIRLEEISLSSRRGGAYLQTTVNIRPGQTLVLGSSPKEGSTATLLLTVRAEEVPTLPGQ